jgi:hypothetical protein
MRPELAYGLAAGAGMSCWMLLEYALGLHTRYFAAAQYTGWMTEVILVAALYLLLRRRLLRLNRYWLPAWEGARSGLLASLIAALIFYVFLATYVFFIHPDWADNLLEWQVARMRTGGKPEIDIREYARHFRWTFSPTGLVVSTLGLYTLGGTLASAALTLLINWRHKEIARTG